MHQQRMAGHVSACHQSRRVFAVDARLPSLLVLLVPLVPLVPVARITAQNFVISTLVGKALFLRGDAIALVDGTVMCKRSIALAIAVGVFGMQGADAALRVALASIVQVQATAW